MKNAVIVQNSRYNFTPNPDVRPFMFKPLAVYIGLRYTRAKRRSRFVSFISLSSLIGIAIGVAALITILSIMNGFVGELRDRLLGMAPHIEVMPIKQRDTIDDWQTLAKQVRQQTPADIQAIVPFVQGQAMFVHHKTVRGVFVRGVFPELEPQVSDISSKMLAGGLDDLQPGSFNILIGVELAGALRLWKGDQAMVIVPQTSVTPVGLIPRMKRMTIAGVFEFGINEVDSGLIVINSQDAARLMRLPPSHANGLNVKLQEVFDAPVANQTLKTQLPEGLRSEDWSMRYASFFGALKTEKIVMTVILSLIIAVAAFNIVSTLVMVVNDKQADIAILRTLGASPRQIMLIFMFQGSFIGVIGASLGLLGGVSLASNIDVLVPWIEETFGVDFFPADVYYVNTVPSDLHVSDVVWITTMSLVISFLATIYPAWRAAGTQPAEALKYE